MRRVTAAFTPTSAIARARCRRRSAAKCFRERRQQNSACSQICDYASDGRRAGERSKRDRSRQTPTRALLLVFSLVRTIADHRNFIFCSFRAHFKSSSLTLVNAAKHRYRRHSHSTRIEVNARALIAVAAAAAAAVVAACPQQPPPCSSEFSSLASASSLSA